MRRVDLFWMVCYQGRNYVAGVIVAGGLQILRKECRGSTVSQVRLVFGSSFTRFLRCSVRSLPSWTLGCDF